MITIPWALMIVISLLALLGLGEGCYIVALRLDNRTLGRLLARTHAEASRHSRSRNSYEELRRVDTREWTP